jgi:hypothetical protein
MCVPCALWQVRARVLCLLLFALLSGDDKNLPACMCATCACRYVCCCHAAATHTSIRHPLIVCAVFLCLCPLCVRAQSVCCCHAAATHTSIQHTLIVCAVFLCLCPLCVRAQSVCCCHAAATHMFIQHTLIVCAVFLCLCPCMCAPAGACAAVTPQPPPGGLCAARLCGACLHALQPSAPGRVLVPLPSGPCQQRDLGMDQGGCSVNAGMEWVLMWVVPHFFHYLHLCFLQSCMCVGCCHPPGLCLSRQA